MHIDRNAPVGVFDSGVGGLTVAREIMRNLPREKIIYFGDTARVPYGNKSPEAVTRFSRQIIHFLREQQVNAIVIACNTASAFAQERVKEDCEVPILGVIKAGAVVAAQETKNKKVGIIGTVGTVGSRIHESMLKSIDPEITVYGQACPLFCPLVEEGMLHDPITTLVAERYLAPLKEEGVDTLILGCTHYPLIRSTIGEIMGEGVRLVNPAYETALELGRLLQRMGLESSQEIQEKYPYRFFTSDLAEQFSAFADSILPYDVSKTEKVDIEKY
ncbi:MAG: glutamate racemase [Blautia sp.]|nr:glutamate racemase [Blautia sp.]